MSSPGLILAFDTSCALGGVAVLENQKILSRLVWDRSVSHGELLTPALEKALAQAGKRLSDVDLIALGHGPGSFTGVRITVNAGRALAYALNRPLSVFDTSEILVSGVSQTQLPVAVLINAHKNLLFVSTFVWTNSFWKRRTELLPMDLQAVEKLLSSPHVCVGDGYSEFMSQMNPTLKKNLVRESQNSDFPQPEVLARIAHEQFDRRQPLVWKDVQALYIRASGAEEKLQESQLQKPE